MVKTNNNKNISNNDTRINEIVKILDKFKKLKNINSKI